MSDDTQRMLAGELLALLAHDLRNPLAALYSNLGYVLSSPEPISADHREALDDGVISCDGIGHVIANLEIVGRALQGRRGEVGACGLEAITESTVDRARKAATGRNVTIVVSTEDDARGAEVQTAGEDFGWALSNLVHNAIQFSPSRGAVRVIVRVAGDRGVVRIEDDGASFSEATRVSTFSAEGQLAAKRLPDGRYGRGLGLLCAGIAADSAGASIDAKSLPSGSGNAFELSAPRI